MRLFWSRRGEVACSAHAPALDSARWSGEGWREITDGDLGRTPYQCQHCQTRPHRRRSRIADAPLILNVDDRPANLYLRDRILRDHGFSVANADCAQKALEVARQLRPHLILLDVHLPDADGRELCQRLKADPEFARVPVVLISATLSGYASQLESLRWGQADGFIREPVEPEALVSLVRSALNRVA